MVVLAGYKTIKEALVNNAEEFGERDPLLIVKEAGKEHGNGSCLTFMSVVQGFNLKTL